ncbi:MAG: GTP-binding protein [Saprospiraceae bacterium]|nr:GTP-binding protein [Saprospiraceae bacterium]
MVSKKIILTGSFGVGKTSLFNQFIHQKFNDKYLTTIGVKVNKKDITVSGQKISLLLWDVAGEITQDKVPTSYFLGTSGVIYVVDLSRPVTFNNLTSDVKFLRELLPDCVLMIVANKKDLLSDEKLQEVASLSPIKWDFATSAKTAENVEALFQSLGKKLL